MNKNNKLEMIYILSEIIIIIIIIVLMLIKIQKTLWIINEKNPNFIFRCTVKDDIEIGVVEDNHFHL